MTTGRINQVTIVFSGVFAGAGRELKVPEARPQRTAPHRAGAGAGPTLAASRLPPSPPGSHRAPSASTRGGSRRCCVGAHRGGPGPGAKLFSDASGRCPPMARRRLARGQSSAESFRRHRWYSPAPLAARDPGRVSKPAPARTIPSPGVAGA